MRTIKLIIMYDGTCYVGWQIQQNGRSVQALVQDAVRRMTGEENFVVGASRTDAGVHALGQVAHFETEAHIACDGFRMGINSCLPEDISVVRAEDVPSGFHARKSSKGKKYIYRLIFALGRRPMLLNKCWFLNQRPDLNAMNAAAKFFVGEHDFSSFCAAGSSVAHSVRKLNKVAIKVSPLAGNFLAGEGEIIDFIFEGNGFVRHMIRNIVGTLVDVGLGNLKVRDVEKILNSKDRNKAGRCAPASGLYLVNVIY